MVDPPANNNDSTSNNNDTGGRSTAPENSNVGPHQRALQHALSDPHEWTLDEQSLLEELITKHASDSIVKRYANIVLILPGKTLDDVALRVRWMNVKAANQQVKPSSSATDSSNSTDSYDHMSYEAIGGKSAQLLEENLKAMKQISANFSAL